jgi:choice-of-anchor C domain-containing protein
VNVPFPSAGRIALLVTAMSIATVPTVQASLRRIALSAPQKSVWESDNLIVNGSFEIIDAKTWPGAAFPVAAGQRSIPGWTVGGVSVDVVFAPYWQASHGAVSLDLSGTHLVNGTYAGSVSQTFATVPGANYILEFDLAGNQYWGGVRHMAVTVAGHTQRYDFSVASSNPAAMGWSRKTTVFTAQGATTTLEFRSLDSSFMGPTLDNVVVKPLAVINETVF